MPFVLRLNHADIIIPKGSEPNAREFYCDFLGFREVEKPKDLQKNGGLWLQLSEVQIHLSIQDGYDPSKTKSHLAYEVFDLEALRTSLKERGIQWNENSPVPGFVRGDIRDPFGNRIEFLQRFEANNNTLDPSRNGNWLVPIGILNVLILLFAVGNLMVDFAILAPDRLQYEIGNLESVKGAIFQSQVQGIEMMRRSALVSCSTLAAGILLNFGALCWFRLKAVKLNMTLDKGKNSR